MVNTYTHLMQSVRHRQIGKGRLKTLDSEDDFQSGCRQNVTHRTVFFRTTLSVTRTITVNELSILLSQELTQILCNVFVKERAYQ